ncbi:MAG: Pyridoxal-dependent decarboxylase [Gemmatimonadetes bacterium]|jgi:L-2,4-diaminobutyrate decarboxylase|nr:Pyridoxal-dependent decarboxylase [Gemmatimonadota bacterium]
MPEPSILASLDADTSAASAMLFTELAVDYLAQTRTGGGPVSTLLAPAELAARFDEPLPRGGMPLERVVQRLRDEVVPDCNRLYHPRYVGHQVSAPVPAAIWTESLTAALNQSLAVSEMSPTATALEHRVVRWMCDLAGYGPASGGTLTSGGTEATLTGLLAARSAAIPDVWTNGVGAEPPVVLCGEHAHYAVSRAVGEMGLGLRSIVVIPSRDWRMDPSALHDALVRLHDAGRRVMAVVATAGSTATGSFDDLVVIGETCRAARVWLHVDGAHGASALLSERHRHRIAGIGLAHSIAWDPHKMMLLPLSAGLVLVREERDLEGAFAQRAPYLFHGAGEGERTIDQGVRSFLCSRRADVLKLWVTLQRHGADGIGALYDHLCDVAMAMHDHLALDPRFEVLHRPESNILCFRWAGDGRLQGDALDAFNRELRERYNRSGAGWITATNLDGKRVLRVTIMNARTTIADVVEVADGIAREAEAMVATARR